MSSLEALVISKVGTLCLFVGRVKNRYAIALSYRVNVCQLPIHYIGLDFNTWL